jgi:hypothetical protein
VYVIRKRIKLTAEKAIYVFVNDILPPTSSFMKALYEEHRDQDGFLYIKYSGENYFGAMAEEAHFEASPGSESLFAHAACPGAHWHVEVPHSADASNGEEPQIHATCRSSHD